MTTTGDDAGGLDSLPKAILFYRQMLQWMGGMGIIVLAVAIRADTGVGGIAVSGGNARAAEDNKMRPRIAETAKTLWLIYVLLTVACALALSRDRCSTPLATVFDHRHRRFFYPRCQYRLLRQSDHQHHHRRVPADFRL